MTDSNPRPEFERLNRELEKGHQAINENVVKRLMSRLERMAEDDPDLRMEVREYQDVISSKIDRE
jgi:hypothetical protein